MRTPPAAVVALPGRRRFGASAAGVPGAALAPGAAPTFSVQDTPLAAGRIGVSWTLKSHHRGSAR